MKYLLLILMKFIRIYKDNNPSKNDCLAKELKESDI